jgi:predicted phage terminase large subunit-like protein
VLRERWENIDLDYYIGFDPAIAVSDRADRTAVVVLGVTKDISQAYIVDVIAKRISFPDQIDLIRELHLRWRPHYIGIESVAYQAALAQQAMRIEGLPPIIPVFPTGKKKEERIMAMTPLFKIGRVQIRASFKDFIDEWLMYDPEVKRPKDDTLDAAEIALGTAGVLLPGMPQVEEEMAAANMDELAARLRKDLEKSADQRGCDEHLGFEW